MKPIENDFEEEPILALAPIAQKVAYDIFTTWPLPKMMEYWLENKPDKALLKFHGCPERFWKKALQAAFVAKTTYFLPNPKFSKAERDYLLSLACTHIGYPLTEYSLKDALYACREKYPIFSRWLLEMYKLNPEQ